MTADFDDLRTAFDEQSTASADLTWMRGCPS